MSLRPEEQNPLTKYQSYDIKHVIVGFRYSEDACTFNITGDLGVSGTLLGATSGDRRMENTKCKGPAIVILNEIQDPTFVLHQAQTNWKFFSQGNPTTGSYVGWMQIHDRIGMLFHQRLRTYCKTLGMALGHITFSWKTFFTGNLPNGERETITTNPMIFHVTDFAQSLSSDVGRAYQMSFVSSYNTFGQLPQFSKMFQTSLTHADGNLHKEIPSSDTNGGGLLSRRQEDALKTAARKNRLDKSKPMKTLQDVFNSLQTEMTEGGYPNKIQIQEWQASVRQDYTKKLIPPKQYLPELPIKYSIKLEDKFSSYKIDNRNLPFEQPEQDQRLEGIRVIPFHMGTDFSEAIDTIMLMSKSVGKDYNAVTPTGYRSTTTVLRTCNGQYNIHTNINSYKIPINKDTFDTGPGDGVIDGPLEYVYQDSERKGRDIISINYRSSVTPIQKPMEQSVEDADDIGVVYGNREPISTQRMPQTGDDFFTSGYAGNRGFLGAFQINGLESADTASIIKSNLTPSLVKQSTSYGIKITGNPYLMNDINRNPIDVKEGKGNRDGAKWSYTLYDKVEYVPMYMKLTVYMRPEAALAGSGSADVDQTYYYSGYLHITSITTSFINSAFTQTVEGVRTEDSI